MKRYTLAVTGLLVLSGFQSAYAQDTTDPSNETPTTESSSVAPAAAIVDTTLRGRVITGQSTPVSGAQVRVSATQLRSTTDDDGAFTIEGRPAGAFTIAITAAGYEPVSLSVEPGQNDVVVDLKLSSLEELLVVGRATGISRRRVTNSVARVTSEVVNRVPAENITQALQGKIAGANIQTNSGAPGGGIQIRLRGISTINGLSTPLYVVDGVLVSDVSIPNGLFQVSLSSRGSANTQTQDNQVNRLADLNPYDIAEVQVLRGASAAAIYGSKASNGVVIINTKRGDAADPRVDFIQRIGFNQLLNTIGVREFSEEEAVRTYGDDFGDDFIRSFFANGNPVNQHEEDYARRNGMLLETVLSLSGGDGDTDYYVGLLNRSDEGIVPGTKYEKQSAKITLGHTFLEKLKVVGSANVIHSLSDRGISNNDNRSVTPYFIFGGTPSFFSLRPDANGEYPRNPFFANGSNPLQTARLTVNEEDVFRFIGSVQADWTLWDDENNELRLFGVAGVDRFQQNNELDFPRELFFENDDGLPGAALDTTTEAQNYNVSVNAIHKYVTDSKEWEFNTSVGYQFESREVKTVYIFADNLPPGLTDLDSGTQLQVNEIQRKIEDFGVYIQEEVLLFNDLTLVGALRWEQSSVNSDADKFFLFPKAAASYAIPGLPSMFDLLKLRLAYGESGNQPLYGQRFTPLDSSQSISGNSGFVSRRRVATSDLEPERQREIEAGIDVSLWKSRLNLEFTFYQRNITDLVLDRTPAPSTGVSQEFLNGGELRNRGVEITLQATPVRASGFTWDTLITFAHNRSTIIDLPVDPFVTAGFSIGLGAFRIEEGRSASQIVGNVGTDENGNPIIGQVGDGAPDFRMGFLNTFRYETEDYGAVTLSFLLDWQQGSEVVNLTQFIYDLNGLAPDNGDGSGDRRLDAFGDNNTGVYVQDATFLKLRELSIFYDLPYSIVDMIPLARELQLGFTARNVFQITDYEGLDPEVSNFGNQAIGRNIDVAPFPPNRTFWFSVRASF